MPDLGLHLQVRVEKCPIPWVWLDTSIFLRVALLDAGRLTDAVQRGRIGPLKERLAPLIRTGRVLCPEASQADEIWRDRAQFVSALNQFSMGIVMKSRGGLEDAQTSTLMEAYIAGRREIVFPWQAPFFRDPVRELRTVMGSGFSVHVNRGLIHAVDEVKATREKIFDAWEGLRQDRVAHGVTFEVQREMERRAGFTALVEMAGQSMIKGLTGRNDDINEDFAFIHLGELLHEWDQRGGQPRGLPGYARFATSLHFDAQPYMDVESALLARLLTGSEPIQVGDLMDVEHIAGVLPYANLMIVDRKMKNYVQRLGLDVKYGTTVCHSGDVETINAFLDAWASRPAIEREPFTGKRRATVRSQGN